MTYFLDTVPQKHTEFKMMVGTQTKIEYPCKVITEKSGKTFIEYSPKDGETVLKWIDNEQLIDK